MEYKVHNAQRTPPSKKMVFRNDNYDKYDTHMEEPEDQRTQPMVVKKHDAAHHKPIGVSSYSRREVNRYAQNRGKVDDRPRHQHHALRRNVVEKLEEEPEEEMEEELEEGEIRQTT